MTEEAKTEPTVLPLNRDPLCPDARGIVDAIDRSAKGLEQITTLFVGILETARQLIEAIDRLHLSVDDFNRMAREAGLPDMFDEDTVLAEPADESSR